MTEEENEPKAVLLHYLNNAHRSAVWKLEGLSEYDVRRPLTPTGTNLLGVVKHLAMSSWATSVRCSSGLPR